MPGCQEGTIFYPDEHLKMDLSIFVNSRGTSFERAQYVKLEIKRAVRNVLNRLEVRNTCAIVWDDKDWINSIDHPEEFAKSDFGRATIQLKKVKPGESQEIKLDLR